MIEARGHTSGSPSPALSFIHFLLVKEDVHGSEGDAGRRPGGLSDPERDVAGVRSPRDRQHDQSRSVCQGRQRCTVM